MRRGTRTGQQSLAGILLALTVITATSCAEPPSPAITELARTGRAFTELTKKSVPAVVFIQVEKVVGRAPGMQGQENNDPYEFFGDDLFRYFFGPGGRPQPRTRPQPREFKQQGQGSGFLISRDGYILTNHHVVGDSDKILVRLHDGRELEATLIGSDAESEVALIRIEGADFPFLELGSSDDLEIGEWVIAVGNPFGLAETVTAGIVSAKGRGNIGLANYEYFIQTDAAINPGNSGGPLLNIEGKVIGINTAIYSQNGGYMGIGFAIPIDMAKQIKDQLQSDGKVTRGFLGVSIQPVNQELAESFGLDSITGVLVADVIEDSAAERGGVQQGDVILRMNKKTIKDAAGFRNKVAATTPGKSVRLEIVRAGKTLTLDVAVGTLPGSEPDTSEDDDTSDIEDLGMSVQDMDDELATRLGYEGKSGVVVTDVERGSPADQSGIQPGTLIVEVNRMSIESLDDLRKAIRNGPRAGRVLMRIRHRDRTRYVVLKRD